MRAISDREKRTIRIAAAGIAIYLALFFGARIWKSFDQGRRDYLNLVREAGILRQQLEPYQDQAVAVQKWMDEFRLDPAKLTKATVVAEASAAIQKAAAGGRIQLGPIHETPARVANTELSQMQLEAAGPVPAVLAFLHGLEKLGFPLIVDSVQMNADNSKPGNVKLTLTIVILDFTQWREEQASDV